MKRLYSIMIAAICFCGANAQEWKSAENILEIMPHVHIDGMTPFRIPEKSKPTPDTVSVTIIGDVMLHQSQIDNCRDRFARANGKASQASHTDFDFTPCLEGIKGILTDADISIANMEFTLAGPPFSGYPAFAAPDSYAYYVAECGVDVFLTANNHILDKGLSGIRRTLKVYSRMKDSLGILNTGCFADSTDLSGGYPLFMESKGIRIALVNFTYGTNVDIPDAFPKVCRTDTTEIAAAMEKAMEGADIVIALPHWGIEYDLKHCREQREIAEFLARKGADAIIGSHPHVVQDIDSVKVMTAAGEKTVPVAYSLGNIISNMSAKNTQIGLIATLRATRDTDGNVRLLAPEYTFTWCSLPGRLTDSHATVQVREYMSREDDWNDKSDYIKMTETYRRILETLGIEDSKRRK
ncbi:MAG: CapA family protein [Bacteroidales bacterium]|nr:CapA family protein [Bacteroidales bacterium]